MLSRLLLASCLGTFLLASTARAQVASTLPAVLDDQPATGTPLVDPATSFVDSASTGYVSPTFYTSQYTTPGHVGGSFAAVPPPGGPINAPYSYFAAAPAPARVYVGYGVGDFPFNGQAYGHPNDRWTWGYMGGNTGLNRYYYPPVR